jgi:hypothetical protein
MHQNVSSWLQLIQVQAEGTRVNPDFGFLLDDIRIQVLIDPNLTWCIIQEQHGQSSYLQGTCSSLDVG